MQKLVLGVEYDGSMYCGWQKQKCVSSIQSCLEYALSKVSSESILVFCGGRTDSGVHALEQIVHFETQLKCSRSAWTLGVNCHLPNDICVRWVSEVDNSFHARFSAISRRYCYFIYNNRIRSAVFCKRVWSYSRFLDVNKMSKAAQYLLGENDFSVFRSSGSQSCSTNRNIYHLRVIRQGHYVVIDIRANAFLYRMVRNIVGSLVEVGCGNKPVTWILELLKNYRGSLNRITAPASGLYLVEIKYPRYYLFQK
ncbi:tRNA pseudouridine synthase A [Candidatus Blochmanniella floridana]|uniref:tRNA pseudouridine synthase A n=1 Tax=Blochmanniella floridana TaxID=203907 RepID=TRUA_BLOFL|nr:RecName: Full=tRNA pseudouridine synthase A; AltName: Full=tRNA pseudouridine(38-40) synthase; AltName: Full=tRNA pseudouridylate synthase I; AltName: Full=tRNA-uridine isomerase I [Candidatus Blochmannia floridanus]CAD83185.1 tRNA pseudouridine synthase A [Candidatus Blochmannia floridanus]